MSDDHDDFDDVMDYIEKERVLGAIGRTLKNCRAAEKGAARWGFCITGGELAGEPVFYVTTITGERVALTRRMVEDTHDLCLSLAGTAPCTIDALGRGDPDEPAVGLRIVVSVGPHFISAIDFVGVEWYISIDTIADDTLVIAAPAPIPGWPV